LRELVRSFDLGLGYLGIKVKKGCRICYSGYVVGVSFFFFVVVWGVFVFGVGWVY
jgi:hypothetical protein